MGCSDPTSPQSNSHLRYKVSGNYTQTNPAAFNRTGDVPAVFDLCYTLTTGGFYEVLKISYSFRGHLIIDKVAAIFPF